MQVSVSRHARDLVARFRKLHAPRQRRRLAPATTGGEAALASEEISNRDSRRTRVSSFPPRQLVTLHQEVAGEDGAEQSAIKDAARTQEVEREKCSGVVAIFRLREEHQDLRAD